MVRITKTMASPIKIGGGEKLISIKFPKETTSITSLDTTDITTIDVTDCKKNVIDEVKATYGDVVNVDIIAPELPNMNEIYYTTRNNDVVNLASSEYPSNELFGTVQSNTYENNKGVILFSGNAKLSHHMFDNKGTDDEQYNEITSVILPDSVTEIPHSAFQGCSNLQSIDFGNVTSIGKSAFNGCMGITSITIPDSVTSIGSNAFQSCSGLTSITIPDGVTSIGGSAFYDCRGLTSVTIPDSVTSIGDYAFYNCSGLTSITFKGTTAQWKSITKGTNWKYNVPTTCKIICDGDKDAVYTYEINYNPYSKQVDYNVTNTYVVFGLKNYQNGTLLCSTEYHHDIVLDGINNGTTEKVNKGTINVLDGLSYKGRVGDEGVDHPISDTPLNVNWTVTQKSRQ